MATRSEHLEYLKKKRIQNHHRIINDTIEGCFYKFILLNILNWKEKLGEGLILLRKNYITSQFSNKIIAVGLRKFL